MVDRFTLLIDRRQFNEGAALTLFTDDARFVRITASAHALQGIPELRHEVGIAEFLAHVNVATASFGRTLHHCAIKSIVLSEDCAHLTSSVTVCNVRQESGPTLAVQCGGTYICDAIRTAEGWRLRRVIFHLIWSTDIGF